MLNVNNLRGREDTARFTTSGSTKYKNKKNKCHGSLYSCSQEKVAKCEDDMGLSDKKIHVKSIEKLNIYSIIIITEV